MAVATRQLRKEPNWEILNSIRESASSDFQSRVPDATKANFQQTLADMWDYGPTRNDFLNGFINKIGMELARNLSWTNPLAKFKIGLLSNGDTIEEYMVGLVQAQAYNAKRDYLEKDLFGQAVPDVQTSYHKVNRQDIYKITINEPVLKQAFLKEYGLFTLIGQLMQSPITSDNVDEYTLMAGLFREYYDAGGFFKINVPDVSVDSATAADAKTFIRRIRAMSKKIGFVSTHYNAAGMPVAATPDQLELFITPEALAVVDVEALAAAFNLEYSEFGTRYTVVRQEDMRIPGAQAILTTRDFFVVADQRIETRNQPNAMGLYDNYFLHHWQVISASRFVPAILLTSTEESDVVTITDPEVTGIGTPTLYDADGAVVADSTVLRNNLYTIDVKAVTTGDNDATRLVLVGALSERTKLAQTGTLYVSQDEDAASLVVNIIATDDNSITGQLPLTVKGEHVQVWPEPSLQPDTDADKIPEVTPEPVPAAPTSGTNKNKVQIPDAQEGFDYMDGSTKVNGKLLTLTANKTITAVPWAGFEVKGTASWNLVYTA